MTDSAKVENRIRLMTFTNRHLYFVNSAAWGALALALAATFLFWHSMELPVVEETTAGSAGQPRSVEIAVAPVLGTCDWSSFQSVATATTASGRGALAGRFRLAGTFLEYGSAVENRRKAILDDVQTHVQSIVSEGTDFDDITVTRILNDRVVLRQGGVEETLWMTFSGRGAADAGGTQTGEPLADAASDAGVDRFGGKRVGDNRWLFDRRALMAYYAELMDNPDRLVKVFDSLHPLYTEDNQISGYQLRVEGEPEFFDAVGFSEGDVVRSVNSVDMSNRRRAEFFIRQFAEGKASAFVVEVERQGKREKLVYQVR